MNQTTEYFEKNGYVILKDALSKDECRKLTEHMFSLYNQGKTEKDEQCPLSDSVYGDPIFDNILQKFAEPIGASVGRKLLPTYTYARIYRPGEILKKHKDRPSCEISATMTLGFDDECGDSWPIVFDEEKEISISIDIGEMAVYKGCEILHWRKSFKGKWHVQVFFHYVDANGPYKDHYKDGRENFGTVKNISNEINLSNTNSSDKMEMEKSRNILIPPRIYNGVIIQNSDESFPGYFCINSSTLSELKFTNEECKKIIDISNKKYSQTASIGGNLNNSKVSKSIRSAEIYGVTNDEYNRWIYEKVSNIISIMNTVHFRYDITGILHEMQLIEYSSESKIKGHYDWHTDAGPGLCAHRKISFTAQLTDPSEYDGCELVLNNHGQEIIGTKEQGSIHLFPSYMLHKVSPITRGVRYALVIWIHGSSRFK